MKILKFLGNGYESNVYLIKTQNEGIIIDTGTGAYSRQLISDIKEKIDINQIKMILVTHEHYDHCGGIEVIKHIKNADIFAHEHTANVIEQGLNWSASFFNAKQASVPINVQLKGGETIERADFNLEIIYTPGHSKGSISIYEPESKSLFSGDTIFANGDIGRTDFFGGDTLELKKSINILSSYKTLNLYPGHGPFIINDANSHILKAKSFVKYITGNILK